MVVGEQAILVCAPQMAYGDAGQPPHVPQNTYIIYEVEFLSAHPPTAADKHASGPALLHSQPVMPRRNTTRRQSEAIVGSARVNRASRKREARGQPPGGGGTRGHKLSAEPGRNQYRRTPVQAGSRRLPRILTTSRYTTARARGGGECKQAFALT